MKTAYYIGDVAEYIAQIDAEFDHEGDVITPHQESWWRGEDGEEVFPSFVLPCLHGGGYPADLARVLERCLVFGCNPQSVLEIWHEGNYKQTEVVVL